MVNTGSWLIFSAVKFVPTEGCSLDTETPYIVNWFLTSVTAKYEQVGLTEYDSVAVAATWR